MSSETKNLKDDNQIPSWLEEKRDKELGLIPPKMCLNVRIWEQTISAELATPKCLLENALIAEKEGRNVEAPDISKQLLRLREKDTFELAELALRQKRLRYDVSNFFSPAEKKK